MKEKCTGWCETKSNKEEKQIKREVEVIFLEIKFLIF